MAEKWMHKEPHMGLGGLLLEEEPIFPFKDFDWSNFDWSKLKEKHDPLAGKTPIFPLEELKDDMTTTPQPMDIDPIIPVKGWYPFACNAVTLEYFRQALTEMFGIEPSPFCHCSKLGGATSSCCRYGMPLPDGAYEEHRRNILPIWLAYLRQARQSHCFDVDDHPGSCIFGGASIAPLPPSRDFNNKAKLPMELAHRAIQEYNEKKCNVFKYQVLKIEKVNLAKHGNSFQYWMTVKVLNLTLATPIETFQVHGGVHFMNVDDKVIYCFRPKEEEIVGLPCCDVCFGKLSGKEEPLCLEEGVVRKGELPDKFLVHLNSWNDGDFIPKAASMEHREAFRRIYGRYFRQIFQSDGFDLDIYPGDAKEAVYIPYLDFEKEADMLMELANHAIQNYNNRETSVYKYKVSYIEKVNFSVAECREFYMTVKVINLTLRTPLETFQIHAYKGPHEDNVVRLCRKKMLM